MKDRRKNGPFNRLFDILEYQKKAFPQSNAINYFVNNKWQAYSIQDIIDKVDRVSCWLLEYGFKHGDTLAIIPRLGTPEWVILDFACQQIGVILVPVHPISSEEEIAFILNETAVKLCVVADPGLYHQFKPTIEALSFEPGFFHLDTALPGALPALSYDKPTVETLEKLKEIRDGISSEALVAILYTSGTSGQPKGVMLTHQNIASNILFTLTVFPLDPGEKVLSFLPFSHIFERSACYAYLATGSKIFFSLSNDTILHDFQSVQPNFCTTVPRILEKMYDFMQEKKVRSGKLKKIIIGWSLKSAMQSNTLTRGKKKFSLRRELARLLVVRKWRKLLGGKITGMVVGAASLRPELALLVSTAGIKVREGYGMTETSPIISVNRFDPGMNRFGTVGIPIPGVKLKINKEGDDDEGEIWVKGLNVTQGYFKRDDLTRQAFTEDGWFKTGDVGKIVDGKFLKITDRKKDIFKTSAGKYIAPMPLENSIVGSDYIKQCLVIGFNRSYVAAILVPNFNMLEQWCVEENVHWTAPQFMVHNIKVRAKIQSEIDQINEDLPNFKRIKAFILAHDEWTPEAGLLTHSLKPKRKQLLESFSKEIEKLYLS